MKEEKKTASRDGVSIIDLILVMLLTTTLTAAITMTIVVHAFSDLLSNVQVCQ